MRVQSTGADEECSRHYLQFCMRMVPIDHYKSRIFRNQKRNFAINIVQRYHKINKKTGACFY